MTLRHIVACVAIVLASAGTAAAGSPSTIYVTTGTGGQILAIPLDPATGVQNGPAQTLVTSTLELTDLTLKSDGTLYYATTDDIRRVGDGTPVAIVHGAKELRFSAYNCLFYNSGAGTNSVACGNPGQPSGAGGAGLALDLFGRLLAISGNTVIRIPLMPNGTKRAHTTVVSSGLSSPRGIAVASGKGANGLDRGDFVVLDGRYARLYDGKSGELKNATYASVPEGQTINFGDFDADDRLWLATMVANTPTTEPNGRVYHADAGGAVCDDEEGSSCTLAAVLQTTKYLPAVGLALAPSGRQLSETMLPAVQGALQSFKFDFGHSIVEIQAVVINACELRVSAANRLAPDAVALIGNTQFSLNPYLGEEGFPTVYRIETRIDGEEVDASACVEVSPSTKPNVYIAALTSSSVNPRILRCESGCTEVDLIGWWYTGPIENDAQGGGTTDDWSDWLIVEKAVEPNQIRFCGFGAPLTGGRTSFSPGASFTVRAQFSAGGECSTGVFLTDPNAQFLLSLARISPDQERKLLVDESGGRPIMKLEGNAYEFPLTLKNADGTNYEPGRYEITLTDVTPTGTRLRAQQTITFKIAVP